MKKRIVIIDDRPWKMKESVLQLQKENIVFYKTVYYPNDMLDMVSQAKLMEDYEKSTGIEIARVNNHSEFIIQMDELYKIPDIIFLMDYDLKGNMNSEDFLIRINVKYALAKDKNEKRIWFYTSGPNDIKGLLLKTFPDNIISTDYDEGQLYWDNNQVKAAVER